MAGKDSKSARSQWSASGRWTRTARARATEYPITRREPRQEGQHHRNKQETWQVRLNLRSEGTFERVTGITGAGGKVADFPQVLVDGLSLTRGLAPGA